MKSVFNRISTLTLLVFFLQLSQIKAQLPLNLLSGNQESNAFVGMDVFSLGMPFALVITTNFEQNSFRFGATSVGTDAESFNISQLEVGDITVSLEYDRLFKTPAGFFELGSAILVGSNFQSVNRYIETPAFALVFGFRSFIAKKWMFRINASPIFSSSAPTFSAGIGLSYRIGN